MLFRTFILTGIAAAVLATQAAAITLDFEAEDASPSQTVNFSTYAEDGFVFAVSSTGNNAGPAIFDTTCTGYTYNCNTDPDLVPAVQTPGVIL